MLWHEGIGQPVAWPNRHVLKVGIANDGRQLRDIDLSKALFVLPNLFTMSSIVCGFTQILKASSNEPTSRDFLTACLAIVFAAIFDTMDGRVARLTKTQSDFGVQLDSLADLVSFGVARDSRVSLGASGPWGAWISVCLRLRCCWCCSIGSIQCSCGSGAGGDQRLRWLIDSLRRSRRHLLGRVLCSSRDRTLHYSIV